MKEFLVFLTCLIGLCPAESDSPAQQPPMMLYSTGQDLPEEVIHPITGRDVRAQIIAAQMNPQTPAGNYLASRFAQRHHDWKSATRYVDQILRQSPDDVDMQKRGMVLAMGAGEYEKSIEQAQKVLDYEPENALALLLSAMHSFQMEDYQKASELVRSLPEGSLSIFITPLLNSWAQASIGVFDTSTLQNNAIHVYHGLLIADYLGQDDALKQMLERALRAQDMTTLDLERIGDVYAHIGEIEDAQNIYAKILELDPENLSAQTKLEALSAADKTQKVDHFERVSSPAEGLARTMFDMARLLYSDYSDESAKIFAHIALYLDQEAPETRLLLGSIAARNDQPDIAIMHYDHIGPEDQHYFEARRQAADLLEDQGRIEEALTELRALVATHDDLDALVQIGDVYRRAEDFAKAVEVYNQAEEKFNGEIPREYWHIYYVRGMSYEQMGDWPAAEKDLLAALEYYPDNPFVLNYLGYSWADQGVNLKRSLDMIKRAVALRPQDGYITDSLGWVLYRKGRYEESIPHLERAVELLPYDPIINDHLGDAYWQVGRKREARFQWARAKNHSDDQELLTAIADKMVNGVSILPVTQHAARDVELEIDTEIQDALE